MENVRVCSFDAPFFHSLTGVSFYFACGLFGQVSEEDESEELGMSELPSCTLWQCVGTAEMQGCAHHRIYWTVRQSG